MRKQIRYTKKPILFFDTNFGKWRVSRPSRYARSPIDDWSETEKVAKLWNASQGQENRQARLLNAWGSQA